MVTSANKSKRGHGGREEPAIAETQIIELNIKWYLIAKREFGLESPFFCPSFRFVCCSCAVSLTFVSD